MFEDIVQATISQNTVSVDRKTVKGEQITPTGAEPGKILKQVGEHVSSRRVEMIQD